MARGPPRALLVFDEVVAGQYNPDGYEAAGAFVRQLKDSGVKRFKTFTQYRRHEHAWLDLIVPTYLPPGVRVTDVRYNLPVVVVREKAPAWARITGGVDGQGSIKYGIESDEFSQDWILALVERAITPHLRTGLDMVCRRVQMRLLAWMPTRGGAPTVAAL